MQKKCDNPVFFTEENIQMFCEASLRGMARWLKYLLAGQLKTSNGSDIFHRLNFVQILTCGYAIKYYH